MWMGLRLVLLAAASAGCGASSHHDIGDGDADADVDGDSDGDVDAGYRCGDGRPSEPEVCNAIDDDCDGVVDEDVTNECGGCGACERVCAGPPECAYRFEDGENLEVLPEGLRVTGSIPFTTTVLWVTSSREGTVSRIDTRAREVVARYRSSGSEGALAWDVAADLEGHAVLIDRGVGNATRILAAGCPDRDGDGIVETSTGADDVRAWDIDGWSDECIVWSQDVGATAGVAYRVSPTLDGGRVEEVWIGAGDVVHVLDLEDGLESTTYAIGTDVTAIAAGSGGQMWIGSVAACVSSIDVSTEETINHGCAANISVGFGLAVDPDGRVWVGGLGVARLSPLDDVWEAPLGIAELRAAGIALDAEGNAYAGIGPGCFVDADGLEITELDMEGIGWAVDSDGAVWSFDQSDVRAHVLDVGSGEIDSVAAQLEEPTSYSDMTGRALHAVTRPLGRVLQTFAICSADSPGMIDRLEYDADIPQGAQLTFRMRIAGSEGELDGAPWIGLGGASEDGSPVDIAYALRDAGYETVWGVAQVEVTMQTGANDEVVLRELGLQYSCGG